MTDLASIEIFSSNKTTLKETSKRKHDGADVFMTESNIEVVNFDEVKREYMKGIASSETPASSDALYLDNQGQYYLIEFIVTQQAGFFINADSQSIRITIFTLTWCAAS